jgi:hypothetical protein
MFDSLNFVNSIYTDKHLLLSDHKWQITSLFGSTCNCEHFFQKMKVVKSKTRNRLDDESRKAASMWLFSLKATF